MLKQEVHFIDFNGTPQVETHYFNLTQTDVVRLDLELGGLEDYVKNMDPKNNPMTVLNLFERVLLMAYGEKTEDGRHFIRTPERVALFEQSAAYSALVVQLIQDEEFAVKFFNALLTRTTPDVAAEKQNK